MNSNYMTLASLESLLKYRPEEQCPGIGIPMLYLQGEEDELVDPYEARHMFELTKSPVKELAFLKGLDHNMPIHPRRQEVFDRVVDWFERYL